MIIEDCRRCSVKIAIDGQTKSLVFTLEPSVDVAYVEHRTRYAFGVVGRILSYDANIAEIVNKLEADQVYHFVLFSVPQRAGKTKSYFLLPLSFDSSSKNMGRRMFF